MDSSETTAERHVPVFADRCLELLRPALADGGTLVDATLGLGGHTELILTGLPAARVIGIDRDAEAITLAQERLAPFGDRFRAVHATYDRLSEVTGGAVDAVLMDLGVSSLQLDEPDRGFSYSKDAPLDMRMDVTAGEGAAGLLAHADEVELRTILYRWGEERFAPRIAREIVRSRATTPIERTGQLVEIVRRSIPAAARRHGGNPAKRTFQAIRIAVNHELEILTAAVPAAIDSLRPGGRIVVLAYHSLEDRIVKQEFHRRSTSSAPPGLPELDEHRPTLRLLTRGAEKADETEVAANPRSASVRLRAAERIRENA
ncbi:MAG: 16S rRNA (cytosine(1402)-N(4))-methyltransferase RsmH [Actinomycetota bacterium]